MNMITDASREGEAAKRAAYVLLERHHDPLINAARRALLARLLTHDTATIDDGRAVVPVPPGLNPKAFGPVPVPLARTGIIRFAGYARTARSVGHTRPVTIWELADRAAAFAWLIDNPENIDVTLAAEGGDL